MFRRFQTQVWLWSDLAEMAVFMIALILAMSASDAIATLV